MNRHFKDILYLSVLTGMAVNVGCSSGHRGVYERPIDSLNITPADNAQYKHFRPDNFQAIYSEIQRANYPSLESLVRGSPDFLTSQKRLLSEVPEIGNYLGSKVRIGLDLNHKDTLSSTDMAAITYKLGEKFNLPIGIFIYDDAGCKVAGNLIPEDIFRNNQAIDEQIKIQSENGELSFIPIAYSLYVNDSSDVEGRLKETISEGFWEFPGTVGYTDGTTRDNFPRNILINRLEYNLVDDSTYKRDRGKTFRIRF